jgi:hypothetical protein
VSFRGFGPRAALAVAATFVASVILRWDAITYTGWFNPDEAELLAAGRRAAMQVWLPMATSSANTYLVLWPTSLGTLDVLGVPLTMRTAHVLSACAYAAVISMVWVTTARRWGWLWPTIFVAPAAYVALVKYTDFMELGSEVPSVLLLVIGAVLAFPQDRAVSARRLAAVAAIASLAPWFKPQSGLVALALVVSACGFAYLSRATVWTRGEQARRAALLCGGGLAPTVVIVMWMVLGGTWDLFWDEPVAFLRAYLGHDVSGLGFGLGESSAPLGQKVRDLLPVLVRNMVVLGWVFLGLYGAWSGPRTSTRRSAARIAVWAAPVVAALVTLLVLYPVYDHYLNLLFCGAAIAAIAGAGLADPRPEQSPGREVTALSRLAPGVAALVGIVLTLLTVDYPRVQQVFPAPTHTDEPALTALCPTGSSVFVWGWAAELYAYYDWQPASRYVTYGLLLARTPNQESYRARFLQEMTTDPPLCVVNAVGPMWFGANTSEMVLDKEIPETREWLERCYDPNTVELGPVGDPWVDPVTVWRRRADC